MSNAPKSQPASRLALYGTGGFALQTLEMARAAARPLVYVRDDAGAGESFMGHPVIAPANLTNDDALLFVLSSGSVRKTLAERYAALPTGTLIAATALISSDAQIGPGAIICDQAVIEPLARIGAHFQANVGSFIAHECVIGDYVTFAPKVCCNGNVHIGDGAYIGAGAIIRQGTPDKPLIIGAGAIVGMGAVVTKDVPAGAVVVGNPARIKE